MEVGTQAHRLLEVLDRAGDVALLAECRAEVVVDLGVLEPGGDRGAIVRDRLGRAGLAVERERQAAVREPSVGSWASTSWNSAIASSIRPS